MTLLVYIPCPTLKDKPDPPEDQPGCLIKYCEGCKGSMWVSKKKRLIIEHNDPKKLFVRCYDCIKEHLTNMKPEDFPKRWDI
jgi:hypothetical protein